MENSMEGMEDSAKNNSNAGRDPVKMLPGSDWFQRKPAPTQNMTKVREAIYDYIHKNKDRPSYILVGYKFALDLMEEIQAWRNRQLSEENLKPSNREGFESRGKSFPIVSLIRCLFKDWI